MQYHFQHLDIRKVSMNQAASWAISSASHLSAKSLHFTFLCWKVSLATRTVELLHKRTPYPSPTAKGSAARSRATTLPRDNKNTDGKTAKAQERQDGLCFSHMLGGLSLPALFLIFPLLGCSTKDTLTLHYGRRKKTGKQQCSRGIWTILNEKGHKWTQPASKIYATQIGSIEKRKIMRKED